MEPKLCKRKCKFPETVLAFYIKSYCKQKGSFKTKYQSNLIEATKSWVSLTAEQKQQVNVIYKEKEHKFKLKCFDQLKHAEPYMKIKDPTGQKTADLISSSSVIQETDVQTYDLGSQEKEYDNQIEIDGDSLDCEPELMINIGNNVDHDEHKIQTVEDISEKLSTFEHEHTRPSLVEPIPPALKTSKDLFLMLNPSDGTSSISWKELTSLEKSQYGRALSLLKKDYITKYKAYLESLTSRELYDYYNKMLW